MHLIVSFWFYRVYCLICLASQELHKKRLQIKEKPKCKGKSRGTSLSHTFICTRLCVIIHLSIVPSYLIIAFYLLGSTKKNTKVTSDCSIVDKDESIGNVAIDVQHTASAAGTQVVCVVNTVGNCVWTVEIIFLSLESCKLFFPLFCCPWGKKE